MQFAVVDEPKLWVLLDDVGDDGGVSLDRRGIQKPPTIKRTVSQAEQELFYFQALDSALHPDGARLGCRE
jgi:hypothetical protein